MTSIIAVLLPVYKKDSVTYLREAVESIYGQTYQDFLLYIGVDGPIGDDLKGYLAQVEVHPKTKVIWFEENRGLACVLNDLLDICFKGGFEYIARMDADDISLPERFEKQQKYLQEHPEIDVVGVPARIIYL